MIEPEELRLGNYLTDKFGLLYQVFNIQRSTIRLFVINNDLEDVLLPLENIGPIDLTEEWLIKFGLHKSHGDYRVYKGDMYPDQSLYIRNTTGSEWGLTEHGDDYSFGKPIKYVHQLQNLFYALTTEELTIKE